MAKVIEVFEVVEVVEVVEVIEVVEVVEVIDVIEVIEVIEVVEVAGPSSARLCSTRVKHSASPLGAPLLISHQVEEAPECFFLYIHLSVIAQKEGEDLLEYWFSGQGVPSDEVGEGSTLPSSSNGAYSQGSPSGHIL